MVDKRYHVKEDNEEFHTVSLDWLTFRLLKCSGECHDLELSWQ